tara:strand:+ start:76683 stop:79187 length:2505 start_codon:yes stop_codon:yes gene_type:complete
MSLISIFSLTVLCLYTGLAVMIYRMSGDRLFKVGAYVAFATSCMIAAALYLAYTPGEYPVFQHPAEIALVLLILGILIILVTRIREFRKFGTIVDPVTDAGNQLHSMLNSLPLQAAYITPDFRYGFANRAYCKVLGKPPAQVIGQKLSSLIPDDILLTIMPNLEKAMSGRQVTWHFDFSRPELDRENGSATYLPVTKRNQVMGVLVVVMDQTELEKAEYNVAISEAKRALAADVAGVGYLEWDTDGTLKDISPEVEKLLDSDANLIFSLWQRGVGNSDGVETAMSGLENDQIENVRFVARDGRTIYLRACLRRLPTTKGVRLLAAIQDVTDHQKAMTDLAESGSRFRDFTESATDWIWEMDPETRFTYLSGGSQDVPDGSSFFTLHKTMAECGVDTTALDYDVVRRRLAAQKPFRNLRVMLQRDDGKVHHVDVSGKPYYHSDGALAGFRGTSFDRTEIVEAESERKRAVDALALAFEKISTIVALYDSEDRVVYCNENYRNNFLLGAASDEILGEKFETLHERFFTGGKFGKPTDSKERWERARKNRRENPADFTRVQMPDGRWLEVTDYVVADGSLLTIASDITKRVASEEKLRSHEAALQLLNRRETLGQMTASIAHELNQPLAAIHNFAAGCVLRAKNNQLKRDDMIAVLTNMVNQSERASAILRSMSTYLHSSDAVRADVPFDDILSAVKLLIQAEITSSGVDVIFDDHTGDAVLTCAKIEIEQLLINLIKNGIEACIEAGRPNARVRVEARCHDEVITIVMADDGNGFCGGISPETAFQAFQSTKEKGLGVGLAICAAIVDSHGGSIEITKSNESGACLSVTLPLAGQE